MEGKSLTAFWARQSRDLLNHWGSYWAASDKLDACLANAGTSGARHKLYDLRRHFTAWYTNPHNPAYF